MMKIEIENHLKNTLIPFWSAMEDQVNGGFYGYMDHDLALQKEADKGCILMSRITCFFSNAYMLLVAMLGWVIFRFTNLDLGIILAKSLFGMNGNAMSNFLTVNTLKSNMFLLAVCVVVCTPLAKKLRSSIENRLAYSGKENGVVGTVWSVVFYSLIPVILLLLSTASLVGDSYNPFIYFQF